MPKRTSAAMPTTTAIAKVGPLTPPPPCNHAFTVRTSPLIGANSSWRSLVGPSAIRSHAHHPTGDGHRREHHAEQRRAPASNRPAQEQHDHDFLREHGCDGNEERASRCGAGVERTRDERETERKRVGNVTLIVANAPGNSGTTTVHARNCFGRRPRMAELSESITGRGAANVCSQRLEPVGRLVAT